MLTTKNKNFLEILNFHKENSGDKVFITHYKGGDRIEFKYKEVEELVNKLANFLKIKGVVKGDRVAILLVNSPEFIISLLAIQKLGAIPVPINTFFKKKEIKHILNNSGAKFLISQARFSDELLHLIYRTKVKKVLWKDEKLYDDYSVDDYTFKDVLKTEPLTNFSPPVDTDDIALILYTSGTTGRPKGVMLTYKNLFSNIKNIVGVMKFSSEDRFIVYLPMFHTFTLTAMILTPLYLGAQISILKSVKPFSKVLEVVENDKITVFMGVPEVYHLLSKVDLQSDWGKSVKYFISGGSPLPMAVAQMFSRRFKGKKILEGYGLTESSPAVSVNSPTEYKLGSVGKPLPDYKVKIVDEDLDELGIKEIGEIAVKGDNVMKGYFRNPKETKKVIRNGWLLTGDLGYIDEDGFLFIVGRKKDIIISKGINIYPREIEEVLLKHPYIEECAVIGKNYEIGGEIPVAFVKLKKNHHLTEQEIKDYLAKHISNYKIPKVFYFVSELPKNQSGKVLKRVLKEIVEKTCKFN